MECNFFFFVSLFDCVIIYLFSTTPTPAFCLARPMHLLEVVIGLRGVLFALHLRLLPLVLFSQHHRLVFRIKAINITLHKELREAGVHNRLGHKPSVRWVPHNSRISERLHAAVA
ncbi:hypothetical protein TcCL_ESM08358 [Trypanosoma cruzi]|nr:hypothetical protein TcCL_ESM08358 [Trypanosoma cruzi]